MKSTPTHTYSLCPNCSECPAVEFHGDGTVRIGESPNIVSLARVEWNELVKAVKAGALDELA